KAVDHAGATPLAGMRITAPDGTAVTGTYRAIGAWRPYRDHALALGREVLDAILVDRVRALGVELRERTRVTDVLVDDGHGVVVPLADAAAWSHRLEDFFTARVGQLAHLARRVAGAERTAPVQAMGPLAYDVAAPTVGGLLLVGDAAGFYDPLTGEGVFSALRGAELASDVAAAALQAGDWSAERLGSYQRARRRVFAAKARFTHA